MLTIVTGKYGNCNPTYLKSKEGNLDGSISIKDLGKHFYALGYKIIFGSSSGRWFSDSMGYKNVQNSVVRQMVSISGSQPF